MGRLLDFVAGADPSTVGVVREWLANGFPEPDTLWGLAVGPHRTPSEEAPVRGPAGEIRPGFRRAVAGDRRRRRAGRWSLTRARAARRGPTCSVPPRVDGAGPGRRVPRPEADPGQRLSAAQDLARLGSIAELCRVLPEADRRSSPTSSPPSSAIPKPRSSRSGRSSGTARRSEPRRRAAEAGRPPAQCRGRAPGAGVRALVWPLLGASPDCSLRTELIARCASTACRSNCSCAARRPCATRSSTGDFGSPSPRTARCCRRTRKNTDPQTAVGGGGRTRRTSRNGPPSNGLPRNGVRPNCYRRGTIFPRGADWHVNPAGHTFLEIHGPAEFVMGSPESERRRDRGGSSTGGQDRPRLRHRRTQGYRRSVPQLSSRLRHGPTVSPTADCPATAISWVDAAKYCRWLSEQEHVPEDQMCYPPLDKIVTTWVAADLLLRTGYRLPTEAEWNRLRRDVHQLLLRG